MNRGRIVWSAAVLVGFSLAGLDFRAEPSKNVAAKAREKRASALLPVQPVQEVKRHAAESYGKLPLSFEANRGQTDRHVKFLSRGKGYTLFLTPTEAVLALRKPSDPQVQNGIDDLETITRPKRRVPDAGAVAVLRMELVGASARPEVLGMQELPGKSNYFIGNDPKQWRTNVPNYARVQFKGVYGGVDLVYYGNQRQLEYDFVIAPGADPKAITLAAEGADKLEVNEQGDLILHVAGEQIRLQKPAIYQEVRGSRQEISGGYVLKSKRRVGFHVAEYDARKPLIIDPVLSYSTYLGGTSFDQAFGIAVDSAGNAYISGTTSSTNFPTTMGAFRTVLSTGTCGTPPGTFPCPDAFVTKLNPTNPTGSALVYSTYLGGSGNEDGLGIAVDASGNAYVTGDTDSLDFPTTTDAFQGSNRGTSNAFVAKLNANGSGLIYSTYLGGENLDAGFGIAVDSLENAYVTGQTSSGSFPTTVNPFQKFSGGGAFKSLDGAMIWNPINSGLASPNILALASDLGKPQTLYAGTQGRGAFRSIDGGGSWNAVNTGLTAINIHVLVIDPSTPQTVYAGTGAAGVFKSMNGGDAWSPINAGLGNLSVRALAIDPAVPATVYAGTVGGGIFKTENGGGNWTPVNTGLGDFNVRALAIDPKTPQTIYAGTSGGVFKTINGGANWIAVNTGITNLFIRVLAADPVSSGTVYAGTSLGLFKTTNGGGSWTAINTGLTNFGIPAFVIDPTLPSTLYVSTFNSGVFRSINGGANWVPFVNALSNLRVTALAIDRSAPSTLYAGSVVIDAFVTKFSPTGTALYSTYLGGGSSEAGIGIAVDSSGNAYVAGFTNSRNYPTQNPTQAFAGDLDAFVTKLNPTGSALVYSTYLGGGGTDQAFGIAVDASRSPSAYVTGTTNSTNFPTLNPFQSSLAGDFDAFVTKLNPSGALAYSTYLGGGGFDEGNAIAVDAAGNAYVTGDTDSLNFPIANPLRATLNTEGSICGILLCEDAFVTKLDPAGSTVSFSTYLGGNGLDIGSGIKVVGAGNVYVSGLTDSLHFPVVNAFQPSPGGGFGDTDGFVLKIDTASTVAADLSVTASHSPEPVLLGGKVTFTVVVHNLVVQNSTATNASGVTLYVTGPRSPIRLDPVTATPTQGSCTTSSDFVCNLGTLASGASATVTIVGTPDRAGTFVGSVSVGGNESDPNPGNNTATETVHILAAANLAVRKAGSPNPVNVGSNLTYTITVSNSGPSGATGVTLADTLPPNVTFVSATATQGTCAQASGIVTCNLGNLAFDNSARATIVVTPTLAGTLSNTAVVAAKEPDPNPDNNTASTSTTATGTLPADLSITKVGSPNPVGAGATLTYTILVSNAGPGTAASLRVTDTLPAGVTFVSASGTGWACSQASPGTVACTRDALAVGAAPAITITALAPAMPGTITNNATVASATPDNNPDNNSASTINTVTPLADLSITKSGSPNPVNATATLTYTLTVSNAGPSMASSLRVTDALPTGVKFVSATGTDWTCNQAPPGTVTCTRAILAVGPAPPITITVTAPSEGGSITNTASVTANEPDPNTTNNTASVTTTVFQFSQGLVFAAVGSGHVKVFKPDGTLVQTLDTGLGGLTAGMTFDNSSNLYVADFSFSNVSKFDHNGNLLGTFGSGYNAHPESIVQSLSGHFFVGQADGTHQVLEFDAGGNPVATFSPAVEARGTDWIQLLPDQKTLLYTSEGHSIKSLDLSANQQNHDFATGLPGSNAYAFRILPDGTVLVADTDAVLRLSASGNIIQTYRVPGVPGALFALNLDPNGTDFLTADIVTGIVYRMNIVTGALVSSFNAGLESDNELGGLAIFGEKVGAPAVTLSPASLDFGSQPVGTTSLPQTVTLTNNGTAALTITSIVAGGDFAQTNTCGSSLAPGANCIITVAFTPTAAGSRSGSITITDSAPGSPQSVPLTGSGILTPVITLSSTSLIFGSRLVGTTSPVQTAALTNTGTAVLNIAGIVASGDFAQTNNCGTSVAVSAGCTITATFTPTATGFRTGGVAITSDARGSVPVITLTGIGFAPGISLSSTILIFADQSVGTTSAPQTVTLNNGSGASLTITSIVPSGDFAGTNTCGSSVASGGGCTITVTFTPTARGARTGAITITDSGSGSPRTVTLTGTGAAPVVTLVPPSLTFTGTQTVGTTSLPLPVTLMNSGNATLTIASIAPSLNFFQTNNCGNSVAAGASCTISVTFTPTMPGLLTGTVTITDNAADSPQKISLTGNAVDIGPAVKLSPLSLTFASQPLGTISTQQTATLTNTGNATLTIGSIVPSADFTPATGTTCANGGSVAAGASCIINVSFAPTAIGPRAGAITITDNAGGSPHVINLLGTGTPSGPALSLSSTSLDFGSQPVGSTSPPQTVTLTNSGTATITITSIGKGGDYSVPTNTCGGSVAAGASCTISVTFTPTATGTRNGAITIADNAPNAPHAIALTGTGTDFSITTPPGSTNTATISAGQAATYTMTLAPSGGFNETVTMSCSGVPPGGACSVSPSVFTLNATTKITTTVTTTAHSNAVPVAGPQGVPPLVAPRLGLPWLLGLLAIATLGSLAMFGRKRASLAFGMTTLFALLCLGCAGGAGAPAPVGPTAGTPPGNYMLTITASTSNGFSHSSALSLTVK